MKRLLYSGDIMDSREALNAIKAVMKESTSLVFSRYTCVTEIKLERISLSILHRVEHCTQRK